MVSRYITLHPKTMRHRIGWGRVKGPLGKAKMLMIMKKNENTPKAGKEIGLVIARVPDKGIVDEAGNAEEQKGDCVRFVENFKLNIIHRFFVDGCEHLFEGTGRFVLAHLGHEEAVIEAVTFSFSCHSFDECKL